MYAFAKPADFKFPWEKDTKFGRKVGGVTSLEGQLSSAWINQQFIYPRIYAHPIAAA